METNKEMFNRLIKNSDRDIACELARFEGKHGLAPAGRIVERVWQYKMAQKQANLYKITIGSTLAGTVIGALIQHFL